MSAFGGLSFGAPWVLGALVLLPAIWWLLRVTPPAPRRVVFPPFRLLLGLAAPQETPARTPLWLLALRLAVAALVVVALAEPTVGRQATAVGQGPLVLFVDNDWMAAHAWKDRDAAISDALASAARANRAVAIIPTATASAPLVTLLDAGEAERDARALVPQAFPPNRVRAATAVANAHFSARPDIVWLSDGLDHGDAEKTARILRHAGRLKIFADAAGNGPLALTAEHNEANGFAVDVIRSDGEGARDGTIRLWARMAKASPPRISISRPAVRKPARGSSCRSRCATKRGASSSMGSIRRAPCACSAPMRVAAPWASSLPAIWKTSSRFCRASFILRAR